MKALVVDGSSVRRRIVMAALARIEITDVAQAPDGDHAIAAVVEQDFDVIVMDMQLAVVPGLQALRQIRNMKCLAPIVMIGDEATAQRAMAVKGAGGSAYLVRPFEPAVLGAKVRELLAANSTA
jgi:DNA-binding response OmpR family regulator